MVAMLGSWDGTEGRASGSAIDKPDMADSRPISANSNKQMVCELRLRRERTKTD